MTGRKYKLVLRMFQSASNELHSSYTICDLTESLDEQNGILRNEYQLHADIKVPVRLRKAAKVRSNMSSGVPKAATDNSSPERR